MNINKIILLVIHVFCISTIFSADLHKRNPVVTTYDPIILVVDPQKNQLLEQWKSAVKALKDKKSWEISGLVNAQWKQNAVNIASDRLEYESDEKKRIQEQSAIETQLVEAFKKYHQKKEDSEVAEFRANSQIQSFFIAVAEEMDRREQLKKRKQSLGRQLERKKIELAEVKLSDSWQKKLFEISRDSLNWDKATEQPTHEYIKDLVLFVIKVLKHVEPKTTLIIDLFKEDLQSRLVKIYRQEHENEIIPGFIEDASDFTLSQADASKITTILHLFNRELQAAIGKSSLKDQIKDFTKQVAVEDIKSELENWEQKVLSVKQDEQSKSQQKISAMQQAKVAAEEENVIDKSILHARIKENKQELNKQYIKTLKPALKRFNALLTAINNNGPDRNWQITIAHKAIELIKNHGLNKDEIINDIKTEIDNYRKTLWFPWFFGRNLQKIKNNIVNTINKRLETLLYMPELTLKIDPWRE